MFDLRQSQAQPAIAERGDIDPVGVVAVYANSREAEGRGRAVYLYDAANHRYCPLSEETLLGMGRGVYQCTRGGEYMADPADLQKERLGDRIGTLDVEGGYYAL